MKKEAIKRLIKDVLIVLLTYLISYLLLNAGDGSNVAASAILPYFIAALPMGWRWSSKIVHAVSMQGVVQKALFSVFLGFIAVPVIIIGDIIRVIVTKDEVVKVEVEEKK